MWWPKVSQDTSCLFQTLVPVHHRSINQCCLVWVHLIKFARNSDVELRLCQPKNAIHFLPHIKHPFNCSKMEWNSATMHMCPDDLDQVKERLVSYNTKWTSIQFNVCFHFGNIFCFILLIFKVRQPAEIFVLLLKLLWNRTLKFNVIWKPTSMHVSSGFRTENNHWGSSTDCRVDCLILQGHSPMWQWLHFVDLCTGALLWRSKDTSSCSLTAFFLGYLL